jgi:nucleoside-diphosphate-sugar epimerase
LQFYKAYPQNLDLFDTNATPHVEGMAQVHTVFGAGQVGLKLATVLAQQGHAVRLVRRGPAGPAIPGIDWMSGDATDLEFATAAATGAQTVYNCMNPPDYAQWDGILQPLHRTVRAAAARTGSKLVQLDCLYSYGRPASCPFDETEPRRPCSPKGELRKMLLEELLQAHERGEVRATIGLASDFFGPDTPLSMALRDDVLDAIVGGGTAWMVCNLDTPHGYSYTPDVARGLAVLGTHDQALGRPWHLPMSARGTTRELLERAAAAAGTTVKIRRVPDWVIRGAGIFASLPAALAEMAYQWQIPYVMDDSAFVRTFGMAATGLDQALATTLEAHRQRGDAIAA